MAVAEAPFDAKGLRRQAATLRRRILLVLATAIALAFLAGSAFLWVNAQEERRTIVQDIQVQALTTSGTFDREVAAAQALLRGLSQSPALVFGDLQSFYDQLTRTPKPEGSWFVLWNTERQLLNTLRPFGATLPARAGIEGAEAGFERVRRRGFSISDRIIGPVAGVPTVSANLRLDGADGEMSGVLTVVLPQERLEAVVRAVPAPPGWTTILLDRSLVPAAASGSMPVPPLPAEVAGRMDGPPADWSLLFHDRAGGQLVAVQHSGVTDYTTLLAMPLVLVNAPVVAAGRQIATSGASLLVLGSLTGLLALRQAGRVADAAVQTERRLGLAEARYASLWNDSPEGLFLVAVTADGRFIYEGVNPAHARSAGLAFEDVVGREPGDCLPPAAAATVTAHYRACVEKGVPMVHDELLDLPAGRRHWQTHLAPVRDPDTGRIVALVGTARDRTEIAAARRDVRDLSGRLLSAQEEERRRIALDLHDSTAQHIVAASLALMRVQATAGDRPGAREAIAGLRSSLDEAQTEIRTLSYLLTPPRLRGEGLEAALRGFVAGFSSRTGLAGVVRMAGDVESLPDDMQAMVLRVVQEALANVHRHAGARRVGVLLRCGAGGLRLRIADDGRGMAGALTDRALLGVGIPGMEARIRQFGGTMTLSSSPRGTVLRALVPLNGGAGPPGAGERCA